MNIIMKAFHYTLILGLSAIGVAVALTALSLLASIAGALLSSTLGCAILILIFWFAYKSWRKDHGNDIRL